jgi:hypothetical protein
MPYSQFNTLKSLKKQLGLSVTNQQLFEKIDLIEPSAWLKESLTLAINHKTAFFSEKSRSEAIVFPILVSLQAMTNYQFALYSGANLDAEKEKGLNGECDYILGKGEQGSELECPIFCIVEAKDNDIDIGVPQCIAQMFGATIYNQQENNNISLIYGCVTTGETWQFIKFENNTAYIDTNRFYLTQLPEILGVINYIIQKA